MNEFVDSLLVLLDDSDSNIVRYAVDALKGFPSPVVEGELRRRLPRMAPECIGPVLSTLRQISPGRETELLEGSLGSADGEIRLQAVLILGDCAAERSVPCLREALAREDNPQTRASLLAILADFPEHVKASEVTAFLHDADRRVRANAIELLEKVTTALPVSELMPMVDDEAPRVRANAMRALWKTHREDFIARIQGEFVSGDLGRRLAAIHLLGYLPDYPDVSKVLLALLQDPEAPVRVRAAQSLEHLGNPIEPTTLLLLYLRESEGEVQNLLGRVLKSSNRRALISSLNERLVDPAEELRTKANAARCMGELGDPSAIPHLLAQLSATDVRLRANVIEGLGQLGDPNLVDILMPFLTDEVPRIAANAAIAVWNLGGRDVVERLARLMSTADPASQASAIYALGEIGMVEFVGPLNELLNQVNSSLVMTDSQKRIQRNILGALEKIRKRTRPDDGHA